MIVLVIEVLSAFGLVLACCELGEQFSAEFDDINVVIDRFKWYSFPIEVQRMLPYIILIAQQPVAIECFGKVLCLRSTYKSVSFDMISTSKSYIPHERTEIYLIFL